DGALLDAAEDVGYPLMVKAAAGGGGRGMRLLRDGSGLAQAIVAARSEAISAFGSGELILERALIRPRHVEIQVFGDQYGTIVHLGERDCSVQRRHQKVIEESPCPVATPELRTQMGAAAVAAARAVQYVGAGTVEFLLAEDGTFYFLEMNTRLQVEHPVTEAVLGVDLVAMQIAVAEGRPLSEVLPGGSSVELAPKGHAIEVRLYAEDPAAGYQPQSGKLSRFDIPGVVGEFTNPGRVGIRLDSGVGAGDEIGTFYDAMIAKVIAWAPTRDQALRALSGSLAAARIHGVVTNRDLLVNLLRDPVVVESRMDTTWLDGADLTALGSAATGDDATLMSAFAATIAIAEVDRAKRPVQQRIASGFRNVVAAPLSRSFNDSNGDAVTVEWFGGRDFTLAGRDDVTVTGVAVPPDAGTSTFEESGQPVEVDIDIDGLGYRFCVYLDSERVDVESALGHIALRRTPRFVDPADQLSEGSLLAPMPGSIVSIEVSVGDEVTEGQTLLVMEAMKMQHTISSPYAGTVGELPAGAGQQVDAGAVLAVVQPSSTDQQEQS
ncbi:MAG: ATP-grasp domain-containing protein, partial [Microthrixaceae bacterium]|nr:ATP-grasp domain-containing protein [Microthrixaceae bacterium]